MKTTRIEMPDRLITVEGGYAQDVATIIQQASAPRATSTLAHNAEEEPPLEIPALNFDAVRHVGGGRMPDSELRKLETPANYGALGPVPSDCEEALEVPRVL